MPDQLLMQRKKGLRLGVIIISACLIFLIGWFRERWILNLFLLDLPFLIPRTAPRLESYPMEFSSLFFQLLMDPRWLTTLLLNGAMMLLSALVVWQWFKKKAYFWLLIGSYFSLSLLCGLLIGISILLNNYQLGYGIAQELKNLLQLPFLLILFIPVLRLYEKQNPA